METNHLENVFNECLQQLLAGSTMQQVLTPYADLAEELEPMLHVALAAHHYAKAIRVPEPAQSRSRQRFLATAVQANLAQQEQRARKQPGSGWRGFLNSLFALPAMARVVVILMLALVLGGTTSVVASAQALPGDALYPIKLATEQTRLLLTNGTLAKLDLEQSFDQKRLEELNALLQRSRSEEIVFAGELTSMQETEWTVQGVRVLVQATTSLPERAAPGFYVEVQGLLQADGSVLANRINIRQLELSGMIEAIESDLWIVEGLTVRLDSNTLMRGLPVVGQRAQLAAYRLADGSLLASTITMEGVGQDSAPATPTQIASKTPTATLFVENTPTPSATNISDDDDSPEATQQLVQTEDSGEDNGNDDNGGDDNDNGGDDNSNDDNSNDDNSNDDNSNDDNSNDNSGSGDDPDETDEPDEPTRTPEPDDD